MHYSQFKALFQKQISSTVWTVVNDGVELLTLFKESDAWSFHSKLIEENYFKAMQTQGFKTHKDAMEYALYALESACNIKTGVLKKVRKSPRIYVANYKQWRLEIHNLPHCGWKVSRFLLDPEIEIWEEEMEQAWPDPSLVYGEVLAENDLAWHSIIWGSKLFPSFESALQACFAKKDEI